MSNSKLDLLGAKPLKNSYGRFRFSVEVAIEKRLPKQVSCKS